MTLSQSLVEVKAITCDRPRSEYSEQKIEQAAQLILAAEGIINPIVVARTGINSFRVIDGHFEYYAAARAKEIDLATGETVAAYIVDDNDEIIQQQIELFRNLVSPPVIIDSSPDKNLEIRLTNLETRLDNRLNELKSEYASKAKKLEEEIIHIKSKLPEEIEPLTTFNQAPLPDLITKLGLALGRGTTVNNLAQQIVKSRPFGSLSEVRAKTTGLGEKKMLKIIDRWLNYENF